MDLAFIVVILILSELLYFRLAARFNIIDRPNERSSHTQVTLRGGGIIFYIAIVLYSFISGFQYPWFLVGLTLLTGISFLDDIKSVPNKTRLAVQFVSVLFLFSQWGLYSSYKAWFIILLLIFCVGIINAYNFMDGINGMTGGYSFAVLIPLMLLNRSYAFVDERLIYITPISSAIFCFFNFRTKARCFAGDAGAVCLAFIVMFMLGSLIYKTGNFFYLIFLAIYGVDSVITIMRRIVLGENIFQPHRKHLFQILANELQMPHVKVSSIYVVLQLVISLMSIYWCPSQSQWLFFFLVLFSLVAVYFIVLGVNLKLVRRLTANYQVDIPVE